MNVADAGILRLFTFIEWVKEMLAGMDALRNDNEYNYNDKVGNFGLCSVKR